jgi:hypothetical protein
LLNYNQLNSKYIYDPKIQPLLNQRIDSAAVAGGRVQQALPVIPEQPESRSGAATVSAVHEHQHLERQW